ncbi:hypothetical protein JOD96_000208 [Flavobacterium sp. 1355]|nr:hypothetical protein [Flavobacterium sp. 1355]
MKNYYVNKNEQLNKDHEVHTSDCVYVPTPLNRVYLGIFSECKPAVAEAKKTYTKSNGCKTCCPDCHTS